MPEKKRYAKQNPVKHLTRREANKLAFFPEVEDVRETKNGDWQLVFTTDFQNEVARRYKQGESQSKIFRDHGLGPEVIGRKRIERCIYRWCNHPTRGRVKQLEDIALIREYVQDKEHEEACEQ